MNHAKQSALTSYTPVEWIYREVAAEAIEKGTVGKIFYFDSEEGVLEAEGKLTHIQEFYPNGVFLVLDTEQTVRIDRVITLFGKPGAAYEAYDAFANACLDCMGGYDNGDQ